MEERTNAGYEIIMSIKLPDEEFVLGKKTNATVTEYVTWRTPDGKIYYYGHYIKDERNAIIDLYERAQDEIIWRLSQLNQGEQKND